MKSILLHNLPLLILCYFLYPCMTRAQTGKVGINTTIPQAVLHVKDSSVLFSGGTTLTGSGQQGSPPVSGQGVRMMWYPDKAAFRTGYTAGTHWDKANVGDCSFAAGFGAKASGFISMALGDSAYAEGHYSVALGLLTKASGHIATAFGNRTVSNGNSSTAFGNYSVANGNASTAIGFSTLADGESSLASGESSVANGRSSTAMGFDTRASGWHSTSLGANTIANGYGSLVIGVHNDSLVGPESVPTPASPVFIIGTGTNNFSKSNAMVVRRNGRVGIGENFPAARLHVRDSSVLFSGQINAGMPGPTPASGEGTRMMWYPTKAAFRAGHVLNDQWDQSNIGVSSFAAGNSPKASGANSIAMGESSEATGYSSVAIGWGPAATGTGSLALGRSTVASGDYSTCLGRSNTASAIHATALGYSNNASGINSTAIGDEVTASGQGSTAMGNHTTASGTISTAIGSLTTASGSYSLASGYSTNSIGFYSSTFGYATKTKGYRSAAFGYSTQANGHASLVIGEYNDTIVATQLSSTSTTPYFIIGNGTSNASRSNALVVRRDGRMGLGTNTPDNRLDIRSDGASDTTEILLGLISNTSNRPVIQFSENTTATPTSGMSIEYNGTGGGSDNKIHIRGTDAVRRFTVMNDGRTGIGLETATRELSIFDIGNNGDALIELETSFGGVKEMILGVNQSTGGLFGTVTSTPLTFRTNNTTRVTITNDGNMGVGNSNPLELLHVGTTTGDGIRIGSAETLQDAGGNTMSINGTFVPSMDNLYDVGSASNRWDDIWATNGVIQTSDEREKKDISNLTVGLETLLQLRPVTYRWKDNPNQDIQPGLIAQEVKMILPEVVRSTNHVMDETGTVHKQETDLLGINYALLTPVLIKAIQQQQEIIQQQQARLEQQQSQINDLAAKIINLENK